MPNKHLEEKRTLSIVAPFKGDAASLSKLLGNTYLTQCHLNLFQLSEGIGGQTGLVILTEEALSTDTAAFGRVLDNQPEWSEIPIILLASSRGRSSRETELARMRLPASAGHVVVLERPLSSASLLSAVAAAWRARDRQFDMRDRLADLAEERARLHTLLENIPVGVCFMDTLGRSVISNPLYRSYIPNGVIPSRDPKARSEGFDSYGTKLRPDEYPSERALKGEPAQGVEFCETFDDGRQSWTRVSSVPLYDEGHVIIGAASVIVDINEEKRAELSLRRFNDQLEAKVQERTHELNAAVELLKTESEERARTEEQLRQSMKMEAVGQLTGGIAHDFNNMLTGVLGSLDLIKMRMAKGKIEDIERFMTAAYTSAQRAASLTHRLLAFSRRQSLDAKPVAVNELILTLKDLLQRTVTEQITLRFDLSVNDPWVSVDANQLENALLNLVINARDAMPDGGCLSITTTQSLQTNDAEGMMPRNYVVVEVRDSGCGIPPNLLAKVTEPFFTTKPIGQGTGLGLSMVYGFAKQSDGRLIIDSVPDTGTAVTILLPEHAPTSSVSALVPEGIASGGNQSILLVEDDDAVRLINQEVFEELGYNVCTARDAQEALYLLTKLDRIDILVTDVGLPGMNGRQLAEIVQQRHPQLPVLFLTGYAEGAKARTDYLGPNMQLLTKPFTLELLASTIARILEKREIPEIFA